MSKVVITGACGFIGSCLARRLLSEGVEVVGIDNLSRRGAELHAAELESRSAFTLHRLDLSASPDALELFSQIGNVDAVFHLAAQVAVTTSYLDRMKDFRDNAILSFNVIESVKRFSPGAYCLYASTNKVFGHLTAREAVGMEKPLNPYTPYGVSKAVGELYFTEFGHPEIGLTTCSLRQSCIYGHHQYGVEDQGWVAWFAIANLMGRPITIYGDGNQVRDLLYIDDLIDLYMECWRKRLRGVYPVGGGPANAIQLTEGLAFIREATGQNFTRIDYAETRPGDQPYFVADLNWRESIGIDWRPRMPVREGIVAMIDWIQDNKACIRKVFDL